MIYLSIIWINILQSETVHQSVEKDLNEGNEEGEYQVDVYHLEIGGWRQTVGDVDEQSGQHKHCCQVDSHDGLEEESFEVVGGVADHV